MDADVNGEVVEGQLCSGSSFRTLWLLSRVVAHSVPISTVSSSLDKYPTFLSRVSVIPYLRYSCTGFSGSNRDFIGAVTFGIQDPGSTTVTSPHNVRGEQFSCSTDFITNYLNFFFQYFIFYNKYILTHVTGVAFLPNEPITKVVQYVQIQIKLLQPHMKVKLK